MADEPEARGQEPNLELPPLLGFGRKKKARAAGAAQADPSPEQDVAEATPSPPSEPAAGTADPLGADPVAPPRGGLAPATQKAKRPPPVPPPSSSGTAPASPAPVPPPPVAPDEVATSEAPEVHEEPAAASEPTSAPTSYGEPTPLEPPPAEVEAAGDSDAERTEVIEPAAGGPETWTRPEPQPEPQPEPEPLDRETVDHEPEPPTEQTTVLAPRTYSPPPPAPAPPAPAQEATGEVRVEEPLGWPVEEPIAEPAVGRGSTARQLPAVDPRIAVVLSGALVGFLGVVLTVLAGRGCEAVRGVGSCGGIGLLALLVIVAIEVLLGAALLKAWRLYDPVSTAFLGVGLVAVFVLLFLLSSLDSIWMFVVIPVIGAIAFLVSWWVTTSFVEGSDTG